MLISRNGRVEKNVDAHRGAVLAARWSLDGSALVTGESFTKFDIYQINHGTL